MRQRLVILALLTATSVSFAQGTIQFANSVLSKVKIVRPSSTVDVPTTPDFVNYGVFWGTTSDNLTLVPTLGKNSTLYPGIIDAPNRTAFPIPGAPELSTVWMQIKVWDASFGSDWRAAWGSTFLVGLTDVRQVTLGATEGPGTVIWQSASGVSPNRFDPLAIVIPEPAPAAILALGGGALLLANRKRINQLAKNQIKKERL